MGTAQHQVVGPFRKHGFNGFPDHSFCLGRIKCTAFHGLHPTFTLLFQNPDLLAKSSQRSVVQRSAKRAARGKHTHNPAFCMQYGRFYSGLHAYNRHLGERSAQGINGCGRGRIAGYYNNFAALFQ